MLVLADSVCFFLWCLLLFRVVVSWRLISFSHLVSGPSRGVELPALAVVNITGISPVVSRDSVSHLHGSAPSEFGPGVPARCVPLFVFLVRVRLAARLVINICDDRPNRKLAWCLNVRQCCEMFVLWYKSMPTWDRPLLESSQEFIELPSMTGRGSCEHVTRVDVNYRGFSW